MMPMPLMGALTAAALTLVAAPGPDAVQGGPTASAPKASSSTPPKPDVDPKMAVPAADPPATANKKDDPVKPVTPAPSEPDKPGVRKL